jgi:arsenate reductase
MIIKFYHNSRCSKSRAALALLREQGVPFEIVDYVESPLTHSEIAGLLAKLGLPARDLIRNTEPEFAASGLALDADAAQLIELLVAQPILLQRPIVEIGTRACIGRPPERVLELLG